MHKRLHVLMIERQGWRGLAHYAHNLCQALTEQGADVTLLAPFNYELMELPKNYILKRILFGFTERLSRENLLETSIRKLKGLLKRPYRGHPKGSK